MSNPAGPSIDPSPAERFFGLSARPFSLTPDLRFAYHSRSHTHALEQVTSALRRREGLIVVTGAIGTGKTMLCRSMLESFETRTFLSVILDPGLEVEDLLRTVLTDFGIMRGIEAPAAGPISEVTRHQFVSTLQQFLASLIPLQAHAVVMIDEAQHLKPQVLEQLRLLSNFETDEAKLLQIVLVGQPDLDDVLGRPEMRQLNQRIARRCELQPLSEAEVGDYIERRLTVAASPAALAGGLDAGSTDTAEVVRFSPAAVKAVAGISGGIPRLVNTLCDRALEAAYVHQTRVVNPDAVIEAAAQLRLDVPTRLDLPGPRRTRQLVVAAAALLIIAVGAGWWMTRAVVEAPVREPAAMRQAAPDGDRTRPTPQPPAASPATPGPAANPDGGNTPAAQATVATTPPTASAPAASAAAPASVTPATSSGSFVIGVAAFKTESRARDVAADVAALQLPSSVRPDPTGNWFRVVAGPFSTRDAADAAQEALARGGFPGTRISAVASDTR